MANDKLSQQLAKQLEAEVSSLRDMALKSIDPLVVSKAVAASDEGVQQLIVARVAAGEKLLEVFALQGKCQTEAQVFFRFQPATGIMPAADTGILVFIDVNKGEVTGVADPFVLQPERRVGRPFVTMSALQAAASAGLSAEETKPLTNQEGKFFARLGIGFGGPGGPVHIGFPTDTVCNTSIASTTWSGSPYRPDKTDPETSNDYCDSMAG